MDPNLYTLVKILLAVVLGGVIGFERERGGHYAGIRTHMLVCLTSAFLLSTFITYFEPDSVARVAAAMMTGIGFIGAGAIISQGMKVKGLTTAASVWVAAGLGMIIAIGAVWESIVVTLIAVAVLEIKSSKFLPKKRL
jgi:putative Mg2+ transporter-C (MgtC) family protein